MSWIATGASGGAICWTPKVLATGLDIGYFLISLFDIYSEKVQPSMFGRDNWLYQTSAFRQLFLAATRNDMSFCHRLGQ
jgi:hypothetical protein